MLLALESHNSLRSVSHELLVRELLLNACEESFEVLQLRWEAAESTMQKETALLAIRKAGLQASDIRFLFAGDLLAQTVASSFGTADLGIPFYGLFGACSTMGESLSLGSLCVAGGYGKHILCATSSHLDYSARLQENDGCNCRL